MPLFHLPSYFYGLDLGRQRDHSTLVTPERLTVWLDQLNRFTGERVGQSTSRVSGIHRFPLGTHYQEVAAYTRRAVVATPPSANSVLAMDYTGVGTPVYEMLVANGIGPPRGRVPITRVTITGGGEFTRTKDGVWHVPRLALLDNLQVLFQYRLLRVADGLRDSRALLAQPTAPQGYTIGSRGPAPRLRARNTTTSRWLRPRREGD